MTKYGHNFHWYKTMGIEMQVMEQQIANCRMKNKNSTYTHNTPTLSLNMADLPPTNFQNFDMCLACVPDIEKSLITITQNNHSIE